MVVYFEEIRFYKDICCKDGVSFEIVYRSNRRIPLEYVRDLVISRNSKNSNCSQDELPGPKVDRSMDAGLDDFEIFRKYVSPTGGLVGLGDLWPDVAWCQSVGNKCNICIDRCLYA